MERLIDGYRRFRAEAWPERRREFERLAEQGQTPRTLVIGCVDSRVDPAMILGAAPGELLVVRNVANLVPPYQPDSAYHGTSAALEFAVRVLQVADIIVLGHGMCGGIRALLEGAPPEASDFVAPWMQIAAAARRHALSCDDGSDRQLECEHAAVGLSLDHLRSFPWIAERVAAGTLRLHGGHFDIRTGVLAIRDADGRFVPA